MEPNYLDISKRLKEARKASNLTQQELADLMGVSVSYVKSTERGKKPSIKYLFTVVENCHVSFDWLLIGDQNVMDVQQKSNSDSSAEEFIDVIRKIMSNPDPDIRTWAKVQFRKAFADYFPVKDELNKKEPLK
jgi:transcriptional regulator with XRE-family HTH domain